ncbi:MAG: ATP-binding protein [Elusimicrobiota bacterium]|jgi:two-component system sensor histidine kinase VicK
MAILRLLIVDDDKDLTRNLKAFFERYKYQVDVAHDGLQAIEMAEKSCPHLVFLDIGLPGKSGIEVLQQIKAKDPSIRVIMITGQVESELMEKARKLGADDYVTKPFTLEYLNNEVLGKLHRQLFQDLRSTSQTLAIEREKAELLFAQVTEGVVLFDQQGLIFVANPSARQMLGLPEDLSSWTASKAFASFTVNPPDRLSRLDQEKGEPFDLVRQNPKMLVLECRITPIETSQNECSGYLALFRDVTMDRKADTAMHHFVSLISHKLRTPLVTIRAYPRLLLSEPAASPLNDFQRNALVTIDKQCHVLEDMVNQLIAFSSLDPEELVRQRMSLADLVDEALKFVGNEYKDQLGTIYQGESLSTLFVSVDPTLLQQAVRNVLENALKFGATQVHVSGQAQDGTVTLSVRDNGPGIPPEDRERVFDRFYQVEKSFCGQVPGAGLGLTMARQVVEAHGGKMWVESQVNQGSTFLMQLPASAAESPQ